MQLAYPLLEIKLLHPALQTVQKYRKKITNIKINQRKASKFSKLGRECLE